MLIKEKPLAEAKHDFFCTPSYVRSSKHEALYLILVLKASFKLPLGICKGCVLMVS